MENYQNSLINRKSIQSSGKYLKWIGYLGFIYLFILFIFTIEIRDINSVKDLEKIRNFGYFFLIYSVIIGWLFIQSGRKLMVSLDDQTITYRQSLNGETIKILSDNKQIIGSKVFVNQSVPDGIYHYNSHYINDKFQTQKLLVKDGLVIENYYLEKNEKFIFEKKSKNLPQKGDKVFLLDNQIPENGKVKYYKNLSFYIENGIIIK